MTPPTTGTRPSTTPCADSAANMPGAYRGRDVLAISALAGLAIASTTISQTRSTEYLLNLWLVYSLAGVGFYWIFGLAGRFAFTHTMMMALGAFTSAWVSRSGGSFTIGLVSAMVLTAVVAAVLGLVLRKAHHFYFAIGTIAFGVVVHDVLTEAEGFTGPGGTASGIAPPSVFGREFVTNGEVFWVLLVFLVAALGLGILLRRSPVQRLATAARQDPLVSEVTGIPVVRIQTSLYMLGSATAGVAGALLAHWNGVVGIDSFGIDLDIGFFLMLLLGGVRSIWGPVIGAAIYVALPEVLSSIARLSSVVYGILLLLVILTWPEGVVGGVDRAARWVVGRTDRRSPGDQPLTTERVG